MILLKSGNSFHLQNIKNTKVRKTKPAFQSQNNKHFNSHCLFNQLLLLNRVVSYLQRCCCQCRLLSSLHSCRWGHSGTAGIHSVCPSLCRAARHQTVSYLWKQTEQVRFTRTGNLRQHEADCSASYLRTVCRPALCHTELWPAAHRGLAPGTAINTWRQVKYSVVLADILGKWVRMRMQCKISDNINFSSIEIWIKMNP